MRPHTSAQLIRRGFAPADAHDGLVELRAYASEDVLRRSVNFPRQHAALAAASAHIQIAVVTPRRSGKSDAFMRWVFARCVRRDNYVVRIVASTLAAPTDNFLDCSHTESFVALLRRYKLTDHAHVKRVAGGAIERIKFSWGSEVHVEDAGTMPAIGRKRGFSANLYWVDEAQSLPLLPIVLASLIRPTMADHGGQLVLTGTPSNDIDSLFYLACHSQDSAWATARYYSWDNPFFGATDKERWGSICERVIAPGRHEYALSDDDVQRLRELTREEREAIANGEDAGDLAAWVETLDPDLLREIFGRWTFGGKIYVYRWYEAPQLYWASSPTPMYQATLAQFCIDAPPTLADDLGARVAQLPMRQVAGQPAPHSWCAVVAADPGTETGPSGSAFVVLAYSFTLDYALELWSETKEKFHIGEVLAHCASLVQSLQTHGVTVTHVVGDFASTGVSNRQWSEEFARRLPAQLPLTLPNKTNKREQIAVLNLDLVAGKLKIVAGGPLDTEGRNLRYKPFKPDRHGRPEIDKWRAVTLPSGRTVRLGDHAMDAARYGAAFVPLLCQQTLAEHAPSRPDPLTQALARHNHNSPFRQT